MDEPDHRSSRGSGGTRIFCLLLALLVVMETTVTIVTARQRPRQPKEGKGRLKDTRGFTRDATWMRDEERATFGHHSKKHKTNRKKSDKPNIVFFLTDDQDIELGSMNYMPKTLRILRDGGAWLPNAFVTTPMCCPSRSSMLTGMYVHNHNVYTNNDNCSSVQWQEQYESRTFGVHLSNAGYRTGYFGKYLNEYDGEHIPRGWTEWVGLVKNTRFYNYQLNFNGHKIRHYDNYHKDYLTDLIANDSVTFLKQSKQYFPNRPVAMVLSMPAPHGPEDAAPQYQHLFANDTTHRTPSFNFAPNPDKQWLLQYTGKMEPIHMEFTNMLQQKRLQTLQSVDDAVEKLFHELKELGELDNTYIVYSSDHGYHLGQYGLVKGKATPYEFDIKVPFYMRGPGIPAGVRVPNIALNIDIAPTILDMAQIPIPDYMDGKSILKLFEDADKDGGIVSGQLKKKKAWRDTFLVQRGKITDKKLKNRERLEAQQNKLAGKKQQRLQEECQKLEYQPPCSSKQEWQCLGDEDGKYRIYKCRGGRSQNSVLYSRCNCDAMYAYRQKKMAMLMDKAEKRKQRLFLKNYVNQPDAVRKQKFIKTKKQRRFRRELETPDNSDSQEDQDVIFDPDAVEISDEERKELLLRGVEREEEEVGPLVPRDLREGVEEGDEEDPLLDPNHYEVLPPESVEPAGPVGPVPQEVTDPEPEVDDALANLGVPSHDVSHPGQHMPAQHKPEGGAIDTKPVGPVSCRVISNNTVVCDQQIYTKMDHWRQQKDRLDLLIADYRRKLNQLKDLKRQLIESRLYDQEEFKPETTTSTTTTTTTTTLPVLGADAAIEDLFEEAARDTEEQEEGECDCQLLMDQSNVPKRQLKFEQREQKRQERKEEKKMKREKKREEIRREREERRQERYQKKLEKKGKKNNKNKSETKLDCNAPDMKCFTFDNNHWETPPLWNKTRGSGGGRKRKDPSCHSDGLECALMDNNHWKVEPKWTKGPFCFCPNVNNNTYWCLRTINETHNFLYCEFITGFISYYDIRKDPYQLRNAVYDLSYDALQKLHIMLEKLKGCKGHRECTIRSRPSDELSGSVAAPVSGDEDGSASGELPCHHGNGDIENTIPSMTHSGDDGDAELDPLKEELLFLTNNLRLDDPHDGH